MTGTRLEGHWIRLDVLFSALQKGIRRRDPRLSLFALALLCRGGLWKKACQALLHHSVEECSGLSEPTLRASLLRHMKRLEPQLLRKGVDLNTSSTRQIVLEMGWEVTMASKSRLNTHALLSSYSELAAEAKDIREQLPLENKAMVSYVYSRFKAAYEAQEEKATLKWLALLDLHAPNDVGHGIPRVWRYLEKRGVDLATWRGLIDLKLGLPQWGQKLALIEVILSSFYPIRPAPVTSLDIPSETLDFWRHLWTVPLTPTVRQLIDWDKYLEVVLDIHTMAGQNMDTVAELLSKQPQFPVDTCGAPDHPGMSYANYIQHEFTVCQVLRSKLVSDPYETSARHFLAHLERGHSLPVLGRGISATKPQHIYDRLSQFLTPLPPPAAVEMKDVRPHSDGGTPYVSNESSSANPASSPPPLNRPGSADPVRSHITNKTPCPLPGFQVAHQDIVSGPEHLDQQTVVYCQLGEEPQLGLHPRWFVGTLDGSHWIVQRLPEMNSTLPIYLDRIKGRLGLHSLGLRWSDSWLIQQDLGPGGPYPTQPTGRKRFEVVSWTEAQQTPVLQWPSPWPAELWRELLKMALFRALFGLTRHFQWSDVIGTDQGKKWYSCRELHQELHPLPPVSPRCYSHLLPRVTTQEVQDEFIEYSQGQTAMVRDWLDKWEVILPQLPPPSRPMPDFPTVQTLLTRLYHLRSLFPQENSESDSD